MVVLQYPALREKTGPTLPSLVGFMANGRVGGLASWQAGRRNTKLSKFLNFTGLTIRIFTSFDISAILLVLAMHFSQIFSSKAYFKVCFKVQKTWLPFFMPIPTIKY